MMSKVSASKSRTRMWAVLICFMLFGFLVLIIQLFRIQIIHGEQYQQRAVAQQTRSTTLFARRGTIYDRNDNILAKSADVWNVCISPAEINPEQLDDIAANLSQILEIDKSVIYEEAADRSKYYRRLKRRVERDICDEVLTYMTRNKVSGIFFEQDTKRYYPYGNLASTVVGFTNYDNEGAYGLESYYNSTLSGTPGMVVSAKNAKGADMPYKYQQQYNAKPGNDIVLTIDEAVQHFLEKNLETAIVEHSIGNRAAGVVMNVKTGEILAMATKPDYDPNEPYELQQPSAVEELEEFSIAFPKGTEEYDKKQRDLWYDQWRNKAISDPYEPGSVFKIITAATALDNNLVSLNDTFYCSGEYEVAGITYHCHDRNGHGMQTFAQAIQNSCNPAFIMIGQRIGAPIFAEYMDSFGLGEITGVDLPGEADSILQDFEILNKPGMVELSSTSFGQTFKVTPLQLITAVSAAVNGGDLMEPYVVKQIRDPDGNVLETTQPTVRRQVISEETSAVMRNLVEGVVDGGSGRYAAIPGYRIGGKTGTSEKLDDADDKNILSFVGFAPMEDPQYAVLVMLDEPILEDIFGSTIAAPVVGAIFQEMLPYLGVEPQYTEEQLSEITVKVPDLVGEKPHDAQATLRNLGLQTRLVGNGPEVIKQIPQAWQEAQKGSTVIIYTEEEKLDNDVTVPDVVGMTAMEANTALLELGLNIELRGVTTDGAATIVSEQSPSAGTAAQTGDVVRVTLIRKPQEEEQVTDTLGLEVTLDLEELEDVRGRASAGEEPEEAEEEDAPPEPVVLPHPDDFKKSRDGS